MDKMTAFHGNPTLRKKVLAQMRKHQRADAFIHGSYAQAGRKGEFKGCAVGCTLESMRRIEKLDAIEHSNHALYERYLGIPVMLARLEDRLFENLPRKDAAVWPQKFLSAIAVGADLSMVGPAFMRDLLVNPNGGVQKRAAQHTGERGDKIRASISAVVALFDRWLNTGVRPEISEWQEAHRNAATAAAAADAYAAAATAAAADAYAADAAAYAADAAAYAADAAADATAARRKETRRQADALIRLIKAAPVAKMKKGRRS